MLKSIKEFDLKNKKVIIRVDFNVPIKDGIIIDDYRIKESLATINYAIEKQAKIILLSHLGRIKTKQDKINNTLEPVAKRLSMYLNQEVIFINETRGEKLEAAVDKLKSGEVLLIENTRFEDLDNKKESNNNQKLGQYWASLGDIFINDAFGTCHREHASNVGIASNLPSGIGYLLQKEIEVFKSIINNPKHPLILILGGSKIKDKIGVIKNLITKVDYLLIGGAMANTFLNASGLKVGKSLIDEENITFCQELLKKYSTKIILPIDVVTGLEISEKTLSRTCFISDINENEMCLDIGPNTLKIFKQYLKDSQLIIWNGPMGACEIKKFNQGTKELIKIISQTGATSIIGGGDTASAIINMGYKNKISYISTGGGATLELLAGKVLPGIRILEGEQTE
ncbi:MAG: phosphoglycerate kinase [Bacilli bacterium]